MQQHYSSVHYRPMSAISCRRGSYSPNSAILSVTKADLYSHEAIRNFLARAYHAIRMGDTLRAIRTDDFTQYEAVEREMCRETGDYIRTSEGSNFPICETIAMTLR